MNTVHAQQGDTIDAICHRVYGQTHGITERVLELNTHLSINPILPMGEKIALPVYEKQNDSSIQLWS